MPFPDPQDDEAYERGDRDGVRDAARDAEEAAAAEADNDDHPEEGDDDE